MYCSHTDTYDGESIFLNLRYRPDSLATLSANLSSLGTLHGGALHSLAFQSAFLPFHRSSVDVKSDLLKIRGLRQQVLSILHTCGSSLSFRSTSSSNCTEKTDRIIVNSIHMEICYVERDHHGLLKSSTPCRGYSPVCCYGL